MPFHFLIVEIVILKSFITAENTKEGNDHLKTGLVYVCVSYQNNVCNFFLNSVCISFLGMYGEGLSDMEFEFLWI